MSTGTTPVSKSQYVPGVCNIGPAERAKRRQSGIVGAAITLIALVILIVTRVPDGWRLLLFLPASAAASGFLQDAFHFCAGFGIRGMYNVINSAGITNSVEAEEFRQKDKAKALTILGLSLIIGAAVAIVSFWL